MMVKGDIVTLIAEPHVLKHLGVAEFYNYITGMEFVVDKYFESLKSLTLTSTTKVRFQIMVSKQLVIKKRK